MKQDDNTNLVTIVLASFNVHTMMWFIRLFHGTHILQGKGLCVILWYPTPPPHKIILKNLKRECKIKQQTGIIIFLYTSLSLWIALSLVYLYLTWAERQKEINSFVKSYSWASLLPWVEENSATRIKFFFFTIIVIILLSVTRATLL